MELKHCMLDLETWGTAPGSAIRSIGMVMFDPRNAGFGAEFYCNVDLKSQMLVPLKQDPSTVKWWDQQGKDAQGAFDNPDYPQLTIEDAMAEANAWFKRQKAQQVWSQGSNFDSVLLDVINDRIGRKSPWRFYNTRDTRTCYAMAGFDSKSVPRQGTYHNALDDSKHQVRCVYGAYRKMDKATHSMSFLQASIYKWGQETFGNPDPLAIAKRGLKEYEELVKAIEEGKPAGEIAEECADVNHFLLQIAQTQAKDLEAETLHKFGINQKRDWEVGEDGHNQHVEGT